MRFCGTCGAALAPAAATAEERKLVTVLFIDLVDSTRFAHAIDPEQWRHRMTEFFGATRQEIERFGGAVEKFIGDAVMAIFGVPAVHEDDPERAARAAVATRGRLQPLIEAGRLPQVRMGIDTGEVVANPRAVERGEFLVTGEPVNMAARLQQHAGPGQVLLGARTREAVQHVTDLRPVSSLAIKGRDDPLPAWELLGVALPRERALRAAPFVGRAEELALLAGHVRRLKRDGRGHVITLLGPGGVGKTRLAHEVRLHSEEVHILRGRAIPYGTGVPFWSLGEAIREECGILFGEPLEAARSKLEAVAAALGVPDAAPPLCVALGLGGVAQEVTRDALFRGMLAFLQARAERTPLMLVLEDMHSAEDVTLDFLEHVADRIRHIPLVLLILSRPELLERRQGWMGGKPGATILFLDPLGMEESRGLARAILQDKTAPDALVDLVLERSSGNPLFLEEMLRSLMERGILTLTGDVWALGVPINEVSIPDSIQAVIAARLDALPAEEKHILQVAAVEGKDFWLASVGVVAEDDHAREVVESLIAKELVARRPRSTLLGDEECYAFRHILIRDVAYAMLPKSQRWPKHARHAEWLRQIAGDRHAEVADLIAHHWLQVLSLRRELGLPDDAAARDHAVDNLLVAGDRAAKAYANSTALDHLSRALDLAADKGARSRALWTRGKVWMLLGQYDRAREDFGGVRGLAREAADRRWEAVALDHIGVAFRQQDQIAQALEHLEVGLALAREAGEVALASRILNHIGFTYFSDGRALEAIHAHEEARQVLKADEDLGALADSFHGIGDSLVLLGRFHDSTLSHLESLRIAERIGNRSLAAENLLMIGLSRLRLGELAEAQAAAQRSLTILEEIGDVWNMAAALFNAANIDVALGDFGRALEHARRGLQLARQIGATRLSVFSLLSLGTTCREMENWHGAWQADSEAAELASRVGGARLSSVPAALALDAAALGRAAEAQAILEEAERARETTQARLDFQELVHARGRVQLALGDTVAAAATGRALAEDAAATGALHWRLPGMLLAAESAFALGDFKAAVETFEEAAKEAARMGRQPALWRAVAGLAEGRRALGQSDAAAKLARQAQDVVDGLAATIPDESLRAAFLQSARVQRVAALARR
jgi:class 3 adenylate cyclase/tetratricopeptide (TPR) repeat protein